LIRCASLGSGSSGNCHYVEVDGVGLLLDAGLPFLTIIDRLALINKSMSDVDAVLYTHRHQDHIGAISSIEKRFPRVSIFPLAIKANYYRWKNPEIRITPFLLSHDEECHGCLVEDSNSNKLCYVPDTGCLPESTISHLLECQILLFEFNYDFDLLNSNNKYTDELKDRIDSDVGHMNNKDSREILELLAWPGLKYLTCIHLSEKNNSPAYVQYEAERAVAKEAPGCKVQISTQNEVLPMVTVI